MYVPHVEIVAQRAGDMIRVLKKMETLCTAIGSFWELESDRFKALRGSMIADELRSSPILKSGS